MTNVRTAAYINMHGILRNLEDLCRLDEVSKEIIRNTNISIGFKVRKGPRATIQFSKGQCTVFPESGKCKILLYFKSDEHFNALMDGSANPIPLKGFTKIGFLTKEFTELTKRLEYFLKPTGELLEDPQYRKINTELSLYTAGFSMAQIGNTDPIMEKLAMAMPEGEIAMNIKDGPSLIIKRNGQKLKTEKGMSKNPRARMEFASLDAAFELLSGITDSYTSIASEKLSMSGFVPMLDIVDKLLFKVSEYLN